MFLPQVRFAPANLINIYGECNDKCMRRTPSLYSERGPCNLTAARTLRREEGKAVRQQSNAVFLASSVVP